MELYARHGHGEDHGMTMPTNVTLEAAHPSYFYLAENTGLLYAHVTFAILAWVFALPIAVFLSIGRTKWTLPAHIVFSILNIGAISFGVFYNANTPDLYENNVHHKLGWAFSLLAGVHSLVTLTRALLPKVKSQRQHFVFPAAGYKPTHQHNWSRDSGVGSSDGASPRNSLPGDPGFEDSPYAQEMYGEGGQTEYLHDIDQYDHFEEKAGLLGTSRLDRTVGTFVHALADSRAIRAVGWCYEAVDRIILIMGFTLILTGAVTYGGIFKGIGIYSGLAHFIKGGIFVWVGLLTLGRVMGSCADLGWAWNMKPTAEMVGRKRGKAPSMEFCESFLIFFYGSTNVFLEHLGSEDGVWSPTDLEHVSVAIMFLGGGLAGMLIESKKMRKILNSTITSATSPDTSISHIKEFEEPKSYGYSLNPMPGLVILLLGVMMSSHHQESMVSTMLHSQWGMLFVAAALARGVTYLLMYLNPPTSYLPSRPPTEIITAFCFISGGMIFMSSNTDMVIGMENLGMDAMVVFAILMGLTAFIMAWEIVVLVIKGLAVQAGQKNKILRPLSSASTRE